MLLLAMSSVLMKQQYVLNKCLQTETHIKIRLCIDWLMKILWLKAQRTLTCMGPSTHGYN